MYLFPDEQKQVYIGIIDMYQIMTFMAFAAYTPNEEITLESMTKKTNLLQPVWNLLGNTGLQENDNINSLWNLPASSSIKLPLEYLGKGVYRILVTFDDGVNTKMVTQSDLVRFIHNNIDKFGEIKDLRLSSAPSYIHFIKRVHTVPTTSTALHAFQIMRIKQVNAIGIIDSAGNLVGNISDADLRGFTHDKLPNLFLPVLEFLKSQGTQRVPVTALENTVKEVVEMLVREKVHRIWIVDGHQKPTGVVSMTDVALYFYSATLDVWFSD